MNQQTYRIVFNEARGGLMVVAEMVAARSKGPQGGRVRRGTPSQSASRRMLRAVAFACRWASQAVPMGTVALGLTPMPMQVQAQTVATRIVADPTVAQVRQATVLTTSNGVVQVNIQTPSAAGVSRNTFKQLDVGHQGAILNNSRSNVQTQLGGWVQGNPWLATGAARVILNEVNASSPSQLQGAVEVAGQRAEVVIANPAGIAVNGAGFINASGVTLTTGVPVVNNGQLESYRVQGGSVSVDGQGLDTRTADYTALLSRAAQINAGIWASRLQVVTGPHQMDASTLGTGAPVQPLALTGTGPSPAYALDVGQLGGMYAGKIMLVGTEAGLGVRNAGLVQASSGPLTLTQAGWLSNSGTLQATGGDVQIQTRGTIEQSGTVYSDVNVQLSAQANQTHSGTTAALGNVSIQATGANPDGSAVHIQASTTTVWAAGLSTDGQFTGLHKLMVQASGQIQTAGQALATDQLQLQTPQALITDGAKVQADTLAITAHSLSNVAGQIVQTGTADQTITLAGRLNNSAGLIQSGAHTLSISAQSVDNTAGQLLHAGHGSFHLTSAGQLLNNTQSSTQSAVTDGARIVSMGSLQITAADLSNSGNFYAAKDLSTTASNLNHSGVMYAAGQQNLTLGNALTNSGTIAAAQDLTVTAASMAGTSTNVLAAGMAADGQLTGTGALSVTTTGALQSAGQVLATGSVSLTGAGLDLGHSTTGSTTGDVSLHAASGNVLTKSAQISSPGQLSITANTLVGQKLDNTSGQLSGKQLQMQVGQLDNTLGTLVQTGTGVQTASIQSAGAITNTGGILLANAQDFTVSAGTALTNTDGQIGHAGAGTFTLDTAATDNTRGKILAVGNAALNTGSGSLINTQGAVRAAQDLRLYSDGQIVNDQGELSAGRNLQIGSAQSATPSLHISNQAGQILADQSVAVRAASLSGAGTIVSKGDVSLSLQGDHTLAGVLQSGANLNLSATGQITNPISVQAGKNLSVSANSLDNQANGELRSGQTTSLSMADTLTNRGLIDGADTHIQAGTVNNLGTGRLYGDRVAVAATAISNQEETIAGLTTAATMAGRERVDIGTQTLTNREHALIYSGGDMAIGGALNAKGQATGTAQSIYNNSATIEAAQNLGVQAASIRNANAHFASEVRQTSQMAITEYQGSGATQRYAQGTPDVNTYSDESLHLHTPDGNYEQWTQYDYTRTVKESVVTQSAPGKILAGGGITLTATHLLNDKSQIVAGGALSVQVASLSNVQAQGTKTTSDAGTATSYWRVNQKGTDTTGSSATDYAPAPVQTTTTLSANRYEQNTANASTSAAPAASKTDTLNATSSAPSLSTVAGTATGTTAPKTITGQGRTVQTQTPTTQANTAVPNTNLYRQHPEPAAQYLVETDPRFTQYKTWLGSDYMLGALNLDPAAAQKRLGDGFYEQKLVREQVLALTGNRYLGNYQSDEQEYMALMNSGLTFARQLNLRPGIALTPDQVAQLTSDMVWLVTQEVTLPDGSKQSVLVPQVYVRVKPGDLDGSGALLAGSDVDMSLSGDLSNSGTIAGRKTLSITADNIRNLAGTLGGDSVVLNARQDIDNIGGLIEGVSAAMATAGRDLNLTTTTQSSANKTGNNSFAQTGIDRMAGLYVSGPAGVLLASAGRDLNLTAAQIGNTGTGTTALSAARNLNLGTVTTASSQSLNWDANNHQSQSASQDVGTDIQIAGLLSLRAGQDLNAKAAQVNAGQALNVAAGNNIHLSAGQASQSLDEAHQHTSSGFLSSKTVTTREQLQSTSAMASNLEGRSVNLAAGKDLSVQGSNILADQALALSAGGDVNITAAQNTLNQSNYRQETNSGLMSGGLSISVGNRMQSLDQRNQQSTAAASTVGSTGGSVSIQAGQTYTQTGSDVLAPKGDINITAKTVTLNEARETGSQSSEQQFKQSGLTLAVTSPVISTLQSVQQQAQAAGNTGSDRMKALAAANAALQVKQGAGQVQDAVSKGDATGGAGISLSLGSSSSQSNSQSSADNARGSKLTAGDNIQIQATGAGANSNLTVQGSDIQAAANTTLKADNQVSLLAAQNTTSESSRNQSSSASVGLAISTQGMGVSTSASKATGQGAGNGSTYTNTHVEGGQQVVIQSDADTTLKGATVTGHQVTADVGGNLNIQSLQDQSQYKESGQSAGGSLMVGASSGASLSLGKTSINSHYTSVNEQSAIRAGDGGFEVNAQGKTTLTAGQITSTQAAVDAGKNTFSSAGGTETKDLQNSASYNANSVSAGLGTGVPSPGATLSAGLSGVGIGSDKGSASSSSTAGVSGITGNAQARTGDASTDLKPIFNKDQVKAEVNAQTAITQEFGKQASKAVGEYAGNQLSNLKKQADAEADPAKKAALQAEAAKWEEGGASRVALHAAVGGLTGGAAGAVGAASSQAVIDQVGQALKESNLPTELKQALVLAAGTAVGAATGGTAGAATAFNATNNNYLLHNKLKDEEGELLKLKQKKQSGQCDTTCSSRIGELESLDKLRDDQIAPLIDACEKAGRNNCKGEAIAKNFAEANGFGAEAMKRESNAGTLGSPFSFNNCPSSDKGGCSFGPLQIAADTGMMAGFMDGLRKNPSEEAQNFYKDLQAAGGVSASQNKDPVFIQTWMKLTAKDPQFVQYQIDALVNQNLYPVVQELQKSGIDFNSLSQAQKEAIFSAAVQHGAGTVSKTKGADNVLERAISIAQTEAKPPSFPTYTRQELVYGQVEDQMQAAEESKARLITQQRDLITQQRDLITQQLNLERQKSQLLEQGLGADAEQIQRIQRQANALDSKISGISTQVNGVTQKLGEQDQYIKDAAQYLKSQAQGSLANGEQWLKDFYQQRTQMYPAEAKRYQLELESLLKQYREEQKSKGK